MFQLENQITPVGRMTQSTYLCVILHVKHKKLPILSVFKRFLVLGKSNMAAQMATIFGDVIGLQQHYSSSCWEDERLFNMKAKSATYQKLKGEVP